MIVAERAAPIGIKIRSEMSETSRNKGGAVKNSKIPETKLGGELCDELNQERELSHRPEW